MLAINRSFNWAFDRNVAEKQKKWAKEGKCANALSLGFSCSDVSLTLCTVLLKWEMQSDEGLNVKVHFSKGSPLKAAVVRSYDILSISLKFFTMIDIPSKMLMFIQIGSLFHFF
jgi:hypothetical protein